MDTGKREILGNCFASSGKEKNWPDLPEAVLKVFSVDAKACVTNGCVAVRLAIWDVGDLAKASSF